MLMEIAEPGQAKVKEACKPRVVGIDLGTTNSLVAHVEDGGPRVLGDDPLVPSVVYYDAEPSGPEAGPLGSMTRGRVLVGRAAQAKALDAPRDTLASVK